MSARVFCFSPAHLGAVASAIVNAFDDPRTLFPWFMDGAEAGSICAPGSKAVVECFDRRDYRRALGQFATGVTVVTARASDGRKVGVTVNSFSSVSLDPPLILWNLSRQTPSFIDFTNAMHFAVNVLESRQHHLARQFSTPLPDKFAGVEFGEGTGRVPLFMALSPNLSVARFVSMMAVTVSFSWVKLSSSNTMRVSPSFFTPAATVLPPVILILQNEEHRKSVGSAASTSGGAGRALHMVGSDVQRPPVANGGEARCDGMGRWVHAENL